MEQSQVERNVLVYYWYIVLKDPLFWGPFVILYVLKVGGMTLQEFYVMEATMLFLIMLLEPPSGAFADRYGRKLTVCIGTLFLLVSLVLLSLADSPKDVWVSNTCWAIGTALCSGTEGALLYDSLLVCARSNEFKKIVGVAFGNRLFAIAWCSLIAGVLASFDLQLVLYCSVPGVVGACIATVFFHEPPCIKKERASICSLLKKSVKDLYKNPMLWWATCFLMLVSGVSKIWYGTYNPYFELVELDYRLYGAVFFLLNITAWFFSKNTQRIADRMKDEHTYILMVACVGVPILIMGTFVQKWAVSMTVVQNFTRGLMTPFISDLTNRHVESSARATVLSTQGAVNGLTQMCSLYAFSYLLGMYQLPTALQILGTVTIVLGAVGMCKFRSLSKKLK